MRISCTTIQDFVANLRQEATSGNSVWQKVLRVNRFDRSTSEEVDVRKALRVEVVLQVSCIIEVGDTESYLLEAGEHCGIDYKDGQPELNGSERADELLEELREVAGALSLGIRPGVVDY